MTYHGAVKKEGNVPLRLLLGRLHSGRPYLSLPCFSCTGEERAKIGTEKRKREKKGKRNREKEERSKIGIERREPRDEKEKKKRERKKKNRRKKKRKQREIGKTGEEPVKTVIAGVSTAASSCVLPPPLSPPLTAKLRPYHP